MASAFDGVRKDDASAIRARFLAGAKMIDIRKDFKITDAKRVRDMRDEIFVPLLTDPNAVKALANGPILNPGSFTRLPYARSILTRERQRKNAEALSDTDKNYIRRKSAPPERRSASSLAREFDVHPNTIRAIVKAAA